MLLVAPFLWLIGFGTFLERAAVGFGILALALVAAVAGLGLFIYGLIEKAVMKLTPKVRIAAGIALVVAGFIVELAELFRLAGFIALPVVAVAWALVISGLVVLLFRRSEAPIATGLALVLVAPLPWILIIFTPIKSAFFLFIPFLVAGAIALYGIFLIVLGLAGRRQVG